jgi:hypothetical protein
MHPSRNNRGAAHENGAIESPHGHFKRRASQALLLRGSTEFESVIHYSGWLEGIADKINHRHRARIDEERLHLQPLPPEVWVRVTTSRTIQVRLMVYESCPPG